MSYWSHVYNHIIVKLDEVDVLCERAKVYLEDAQRHDDRAKAYIEEAKALLASVKAIK